MHVDERELARLIADSGLVAPTEVEKLAKEGKPLAALAVAKGLLSRDDLRRMEAYLLGLPFVDLRSRKIDLETLALIPEPVARRRNIVAFRREGNSVEVAALAAEDFAAADFLRKEGFKILPRLTDEESLKQALLSYQRALEESFGRTIREESARIAGLGARGEEPAPALADALVKHALFQNASDLHLEPGADGRALVRYRLAGALHDAFALSANAARAAGRAFKKLAGIGEGAGPGEGRFRLELGEETISCRISSVPVALGERLTIRFAKGGAAGFTLEGLCFDAETAEEVHRALRSGGGLFVAAGPAQSGKTTTLYTFLDLLNTPRANLFTLEDEIEYDLPRINRAAVRPELGFTYPHGFRTILRQDPDVVMIGDLAEPETLRLALGAAERGRIILASLTAETPEVALARLIAFAEVPSRLAPLRMIVSHDIENGGIRRGVYGRESRLPELLGRFSA